MGRSVLDDLGQEVTGIAAPVSICMALTVALVRILNPSGASDAGSVRLATIYYAEEDGDSTGQKLSGALINAIIFVSIIGVMTFVLVLLFKYGCTRLIYVYMAFSGFSIFFVLTGVIAVALLQKAGAQMDWISFSYILFNFAVVGAATLFVLPAPLLLKQSYLVVTGVSVAYVFTWIPEWTTWMVLVAMALYDVIAVLLPGGPLRVLVEMAQEREEDIPALVYQARAVRRSPVMPSGGVGQHFEQGGAEPPPAQHMAAPVLQLPQEEALARESTSARESSISSTMPAPSAHSVETPLITPMSAAVSQDATPAVLQAGPSPHLPPLRVGAGVQLTPEQQAELSAHPSEASAFALPEAIKLGLGDFIFYSVLVGRAAMWDMLTVFACYIAVVAGLGCTLIWLALAHKALPALPISIVLAVAFYFMSRFVMEPVILPMTLRLVYF